MALSALDPRANVDGYFYADTLKAYRAIQRSFAQMSMYSGGDSRARERRSGVLEAPWRTRSRRTISIWSARGWRRDGSSTTSDDRGRGDQRGVPPAHFRRCVRPSAEAIKVDAVPATVIGVAGGRFRRSLFRRQHRHHRAVRADATRRAVATRPRRFDREQLSDVSRAACPSKPRARNCSRDGHPCRRRRCRRRCPKPSGRRCSVSGWTLRRSRQAFRLCATGTAPRSGCFWR